MNPCAKIHDDIVRGAVQRQLQTESHHWRGRADDEAIDWWLWAASELEKVGAIEDANTFLICAMICESAGRNINP